jgi:glycosyltransferase involved in cell wall biosynthesis
MAGTILYIWDSDYPWDIRTEKICRALVGLGYAVHIAARNRARNLEREVLPEGEVHRLGPLNALPPAFNTLTSFPAFFNPRWVRLIRRIIREQRPDIIMVRDLPLCPLAIRAAWGAGVPVVLDMAENYPAMIRAIWDAKRQRPWDVAVRNPRIVEWVERWCLPRLDAVLVVVEESGDRLVRLGVSADRIALVSNTPPRARALGDGRPYRPLDRRQPLEVVYLGLMEIPRGVKELLEAAAMLAQDAPIRLTLIGDGRDLDLLKNHAEKLGLSRDVVRFLGRVPNPEALRLVASADVGVVPHHADEAWNTTIPNKLFDYMAAGLPVVSSNAVPCRRILETSGAGLVYASGDARDLARALTALRDAEARRKYGSAGRAAIAERWHWERSVAALEECLGRLARTAAPDGPPVATETAPRRD